MTSISQYTLDLYEYVNAYLNGEEFSRKDSKIYDTIITDLDSNMNPVGHAMTVYRGLPVEPILGHQRGYISTSKSIDVAKEFGPFILVMHIGPDVPVLDVENVSSIPEEQEIIISRDRHIELVRRDGYTLEVYVS